MSLQAMSAAQALPNEITATQNTVLMALCWFSQDHATCWPSNQAIQKWTKLSERAVRMALRDLEEMGIISTERREGVTSHYRLHLREAVTPAPDAGVNESDTGASGAGEGGISCRSSPASAASPPAFPAAPPASAAPNLSLTSTILLPVCTQIAEGVVVPMAARPASPAMPAPPDVEKEPRGKRLPEGWQPSPANCAYARDHGLDPQREALNFREHWHNKPGEKGRKLNWGQAWETWCRKQEDWAKARGRRGASDAPLLAVAKRTVPEFAGPDQWRVSAVVDRCGDLMKVGPDGCWEGFSLVVADALDGGADPDEHIYPVMREVARSGWRTINNAGYFSFAIAKRRKVAA